MKMRAVVFDQPGGPEVLHLGEREMPVLPPHHLLIRVAYTALNRADTLQRQGLYPPPAGASDILGLEFSGVVAKVGEGCSSSWKEGDRVAGLVAGGAYAEYCVVEEPLAVRLSDTFPLRLAASLPEAWLTAYQLLFLVAKVKAGDRVLIHAGASGVGLAAIQLSREAGAIPYATASGEKHQYTEKVGAEATIDYRKGPFLEPLKEATGGAGINVVLDCIGASYYAQNIEALSLDGVYVLYGCMGGFKTEVDLRLLMKKRITIAASTLRAQPLAYKESLANALWTPERLAKFEDGRLESIIHDVMDWAQAAQAHALMESSGNAGKILLSVDPALG